MEIEVKLFATLREGRKKVQKLKLEENSTVNCVLKFLEIKEDNVAILLVNGRDGTVNTQLNEGDTVSLFPPVGGG